MVCGIQVKVTLMKTSGLMIMQFVRVFLLSFQSVYYVFNILYEPELRLLYCHAPPGWRPNPSSFHLIRNNTINLFPKARFFRYLF